MSNPVDQISSVQSSLIKINSASQEDLQTINGIGPLLSARIIEYRSKVGAISQKDQLHAIKGMRSYQIERMANLIDWSETGDGVNVSPPSIMPAIILSVGIFVVSLYLIYPMISLFLDELSHWENNLVHVYTNTVNLLAIVFTINALLLALLWLLSLFYAQSPILTKGIRIALTSTICGLVLLLIVSALGYFLLEARVDVTDYMSNLLLVVVGVLVLVYLQFLLQLFYLSSDNQPACYDQLYDYSLMPVSIAVLVASLSNKFDALSMDAFLLWISILLLISSLTMVQKRSCFAGLLQELSGWPNVMRNEVDAALKLGNAIKKINEQRFASATIIYLGWMTLLFSFAAGSYCFYKIVIRFIYQS